MFVYYLVKPLLFLLGHSPRFILQGIGKFLAFFAWHFSKSRRHVAMVNAKILGADDPKKTARKSFDYTFMAYLEMFYSNNINKKFVDKYVTIEGIETYNSVKEKEKEIFFISGHFGVWGMLAPILYYATGTKFVTIGRSTKNKVLDRILDDFRRTEGVEYITHRGAIEKLGQYMAKGYHPGVYIDHTALPKDCINADFCGYKVPVIAGIPAMCARKNYPIMFFFGVNEGKNIRVILDGPLYPDKNLPPRERIQKLAEDINKVYEKVYKKYPEQWYLIHRRFKRVEMPNGEMSEFVYEENKHE